MSCPACDKLRQFAVPLKCPTCARPGGQRGGVRPASDLHPRDATLLEQRMEKLERDLDNVRQAWNAEMQSREARKNTDSRLTMQFFNLIYRYRDRLPPDVREMFDDYERAVREAGLLPRVDG